MLPRASSSSSASGLGNCGGGGIIGGAGGKAGGQKGAKSGDVHHFDPGLPSPGASSGVEQCRFGEWNLPFVQLFLFRGDWEDFSLSSVEHGTSFSFVSLLVGGSKSHRFCSSWFPYPV